MPLHNDLPTLNDTLNWHHETKRISERIQRCKTPHVLGIHGDWGSGKTSFMRQLQHSLGGDMPDDGSINVDAVVVLNKADKKKLNDKMITIWFDAWRYQNEPVPIVALLHEMRQQMALLPSLQEKFKKVGAIAFTTVLNILPDIGKAIGIEGIPSADKIAQRGEHWEKNHYAETLTTNSIRQHLLQTIQSLLPSETSRIVIFIDDLDRCNPKAAMRLLEGLKIYLSIPQCVFVIGMNERILVDVISEEASEGADDKKLRASHYLEKICADIYRLPAPSSSATLLQQWIKDLSHRAVLAAALTGIVCLPPNPRRLKALANQWSRFSAYVPYPENDDIDVQKIWAVRVLIAAYIHQFHRDLWERWHFNPNCWLEIQAWCAGERETDKPEWAKPLQMTHQVQGFHEVSSQAILSTKYLNPGDINNFWIGGLIVANIDHLNPDDFIPLLKGQPL